MKALDKEMMPCAADGANLLNEPSATSPPHAQAQMAVPAFDADELFSELVHKFRVSRNNNHSHAADGEHHNDAFMDQATHAQFGKALVRSILSIAIV